MSPRTTAWSIASLLWLAAGPAGADTPQVYDPAAGPGVAKTLDFVSNATVDVYLDVGSDPSQGTVCESGDGDELCAADVTLAVDGPGLIVDFSPPVTGPQVIFDPDPFTPTTTLRLNLLTSLAPVLGPKDLGTLTIDMSGVSQANPSKVEASGHVVDAAGQLQTIPVQMIALPEPSHTWLLLSGLLGLGLLYRIRGTR